MIFIYSIIICSEEQHTLRGLARMTWHKVKTLWICYQGGRYFRLGSDASAPDATVASEGSLDALRPSDLRCLYGGVAGGAVGADALCSSNHLPGGHAHTAGGAASTALALARSTSGEVSRVDAGGDHRSVLHAGVRAAYPAEAGRLGIRTGAYPQGTEGRWRTSPGDRAVWAQASIESTNGYITRRTSTVPGWSGHGRWLPPRHVDYWSISRIGRRGWRRLTSTIILRSSCHIPSGAGQ